MNRISVLVLCTAALLLPALGKAQQSSDYPLTISPIQYQSISAADGPIVNQGCTDLANLWSKLIDLPFPVRYYGQTYTQARITSLGYLSFGTATSTHVNTVLPASSTPNAVVAAWWDDTLCRGSDAVQTQVIGTPGARQFIVQYKGWSYTSTRPIPTGWLGWEAQIILTEGVDLIRVRYGQAIGNNGLSASIGIENETGTIGVAAPGARGTVCNPNCGGADFPSNKEYMYGATQEPDVVPSLLLGGVTESPDGTNLLIPVTTTIKNQGLQPAVGVVWNYYFSNNATLDATDPLMGSHDVAETIPAMGALSFQDSLIWPVPTTAGEYRVCAWADPDGLLPQEANLNNNKACSTNAFTLGPDPAADSVAFVGATTAVPGETVSVHYKLRNGGTKRAVSVPYEILLSRSNTTLDGTRSVFSGTVTLDAAAEFEETIQVRIPANLLGEKFYPVLYVDRQSKNEDAKRSNNAAYGTTVLTMHNPDVVAKTVTLDVGEGCFFGRELTVAYEVCNAGKSTAANFVDAVYLNDASQTSVQLSKMVSAFASPGFCDTNADCDDAQQGVCIEAVMSGGPGLSACHYGCSVNEDCATGMSCVADEHLGGQKSCQNVYMATQCRTLRRVVTVPEIDWDGEALKENHEYVFTVILDPTEQLNEGGASDKILNNISRSPRLTCRYPAPNFQAVSVQAPTRIAAGETVALNRDIQNIGNDPATVSYRFVLSTNSIFSDKDVPLPLIATGGDGTVTVAAKAGSKGTDLVRIPSHMAPGEYFLGLVIDPQRTLHELDKTNNTVAALGKVVVEPSGLQIRTAVLPVGTHGSWYGFQLLAAGGTYDYVWSSAELPPGLELTSKGYLSGRLVDAGSFPFTVQVRSGEATMDAALVLDVRPPTGPLSIDTTVLPLAYTRSTSAYLARIAVSGGNPPYACAYEQLPNRFYPVDGDSCSLRANDGLERAGEYDFSVKVTDAKGTTVKGGLHLSVLENSKLDFKERRFVDEGLVGAPLETCVETLPNRHAGRETENDVSYSWEITDGPMGMTTHVPNPNQPSRGCLVGTPTECGTFMVKVRVETRLGEETEIDEWAEARMPFVVQCRQLMLDSDTIPAVYRGDSIDLQLKATGPNADQATFRVAAGQLPQGIILEADGRLHGTVGADVAYGAHNVVVELNDGNGGHGFAGLSIFVQRTPVEPKPVKKAESSGCSTAGEGGATGALPVVMTLVGLFGLALRRNKVGVPVVARDGVRKGFLGAVAVALLAFPTVGHAAQITSLSGPTRGHPGAVIDLEGAVVNPGEATAFTLRFHGSDKATLPAGAPELAQPVELEVGEGDSSKFSAEVVLPSGLQTADYRVFVTLEAEGATKAQAVWGPFPLGAPMADPAVVSVETPAAAERGSSVDLTWVARNRGSFAAEDVAFHVVLSADRRITREDRTVGGGVISLKDQVPATIVTRVALPSNVPAGTYFVGVILDPEGMFYEIDKANNVGVSPSGFVVRGGALAIGSLEMPPAEAGSTYCAELPVSGGTGSYDWTVVAGSTLPAGLELDKASQSVTLLCGRPSTIGSFTFGLQVESGGERAVGVFELEVLANGMTVSITSSDLPTASFEVPYEAQLRAVGGKAPYSWSLAGGSLPMGLELLPEGRIVGTPIVDGKYRIPFRVVDSVGQAATRTIDLWITSPVRLTCVTTSLPVVQLGQELNFTLAAAGGSKPYSWQTRDTRRLADENLDSGELFPGEAPPGFILDASTGVVTGAPTAVGKYIWDVTVRDTTSSFVTDTCNILVDVVSEQNLSITTKQLADAYAGTPYRAQLRAEGSKQGLSWKLARNNVLPRGMTLNSSGLISGVLDVDLLAGEESRNFAFVVEVRDENNRHAFATLSIRLLKAPADAPKGGGSSDSGGCQAAGGAPGLLGLGTALGLGLLRRRSRR